VPWWEGRDPLGGIRHGHFEAIARSPQVGAQAGGAQGCPQTHRPQARRGPQEAEAQAGRGEAGRRAQLAPGCRESARDAAKRHRPADAAHGLHQPGHGRGQAFLHRGAGIQAVPAHDRRDELPPGRHRAELEPRVHAADGGWRPPREPNLYFMVTDVDAACRALSSRGVAFDQPPQDMPWGHRVAMLKDPEGRRVCLAQQMMK